MVDASRFPGRPYPTDRSYGDLPYRHGTPPTGLAIDEATITVRVAPGPSVGEPASVSAPGGVEVINHTTTVGRERQGAGTLDFIPIWGTNTLLLRGEYPISEAPFVVSVSDPAPELRVARRLHEALGEAGVTVSGTVLMQSQAAGARDQLVELAELRSRPMKDVLKRNPDGEPQLVCRYVDPHIGGGRSRAAVVSKMASRSSPTSSPGSSPTKHRRPVFGSRTALVCRRPTS